jgi:2-keto-3-deoxy-L-rhamnonate aldolase RhmA
MSAPLMMEMIHAVASCPGVSPIVRIPNHDVSWVKWALDAGAHGIMIPMVNTREQMETISKHLPSLSSPSTTNALPPVSHSKYPPFGQRSSGATWAKFGWPATEGASSYAGGAEYAQGADREILIIPQIETKMAVENVDEILVWTLT